MCKQRIGLVGKVRICVIDRHGSYSESGTSTWLVDPDSLLVHGITIRKGALKIIDPAAQEEYIVHIQFESPCFREFSYTTVDHFCIQPEIDIPLFTFFQLLRVRKYERVICGRKRLDIIIVYGPVGFNQEQGVHDIVNSEAKAGDGDRS